MRGNARCYWHGARGGRPVGHPMHENTLAAMKAGRRRWVERTRLAKVQGLIEKFPNGRKAGVRLRDRVRSPDPSEARRQRMAERAIEMALKELPAPLGKPPEEASAAELFADNFRESLLFNREVLKRPINWDDEKLMDRKERVAQSTQIAAVRIKVAELAPPADDSVVNRLMQRVAALRSGARVIDLEPDAKTVEPTG
jgi:hypothetical protein